MWQTPYQSLLGIKGFFSKIVRVGYLSIRSFSQDQCMMRAASLTYYSIMALVPALALAFSVAQWLQVKEYLKVQLYQRFDDQKEILEVLFTFANNLLDRTKGSILAIFGFVFIFWALIKMLTHLESALNTVWQISKKRSFGKKVRDYFAMMLIGPIFFLLSLSATFFIVSWLQEIVQSLPIADTLSPPMIFLIKMAPYGVIWLLFILLYFLMPSQRVPIKPTLIGALIAGAGYQFAQWGFITFQIGVTRASAIYGSFVFLPLFLIWMQLSWSIFLAGAEIGFSIDHVKTYETEKRKERLSFREKKLLSLWIIIRSIEEFMASKHLTKERIIKTFSLSCDVIDYLLDQLVQLKLLSRIVKKNKEGYIPGGSYEHLSFQDIFSLIERKDEAFFSNEGLFQELEKDLEELDEEIKKGTKNKKIIDFIKTQI